MSRTISLSASLVLLAAVACAPAHTTLSTSAVAPATADVTLRGYDQPPRDELPCFGCDSPAAPLSPDLSRAVESRIADLEARGGVCSRYGAVLERSYRSGRITIRPYMWRVGTQLASGEAKPNGEMTLAREIDPLNVGVRTVDDVVRSMEHEAVHIAFDIRAGLEGSEGDADQYVRACSPGTRTTN
jgi:hypothetical protein